MIFYIKSENYITNQYNNILSDLTELQKREHKKMEIILDFLNKLNDFIQDENNIDNVQSFIKMLETLKNLSDNLRTNKNNLENLKILLNKILNENTNNSITISNEMENKIDEYNKLAKECKSSLFLTSEQFENFIIEYMKNMTFPYISNYKEIENVKPIENIEQSNMASNTHSQDSYNENSFSSNNTVKQSATSNNIELNNSMTELKDNRVLLISEKQKKVFLPYYIDDLNKILQKTKKYNNLQEIINFQYVIPISRYSNPIISRFKESYKLMKNKEHASVLESIDLGLELAFNSSLNPAIITACKTLDELDTYLDCLDLDELDKFNSFEIKYEVLPLK